MEDTERFEEEFTFTDTPAGRELMGLVRRDLERNGFVCREEPRSLVGFPVHTLIVTAPARPTRRERGCEL